MNRLKVLQKFAFLKLIISEIERVTENMIERKKCVPVVVLLHSFSSNTFSSGKIFTRVVRDLSGEL
jgi:hypothetical protein